LIRGYLGSGDTFDKAIAAFAKVYADQSERAMTSRWRPLGPGK